MVGNDGAIVREAEPSDAARMARVHTDAWRETYAGVLDDRFFSEDAFERRSGFWGRYLSTTPREGRAVVAERGGTVVGFAHAGEARGPDAEHGYAPARSWHLFSIYLLAGSHGSGAGQAMIDAVLDDEPTQLWVLRGNDRAIAFYKRNGFSFDGVEYENPADPNLIELRMIR